MRAELCVAIAALAVAASGCPRDGNGHHGPIPVEEACEEGAQAACDLYRRCGLETLLGMASHQPCEDLIYCDAEETQATVEAVNAGRLSYDPELVGTCLDQVSDMSCETALSEEIGEVLTERCSTIFAPQQEEGEECYDAAECVDGLYCDESAESCPGECQPVKGIGETCSTSQECGEEDATCVGGECAPNAGEGESCEDRNCAEGLDCSWDLEPPVCVEPQPAGADCEVDDECATMLGCVDGVCSNPVARGEPCSVDLESDSAFFVCELGSYCDADLMAGETEGTCRATKGAGEECFTLLECDAGLVCTGVRINLTTEELTPGACSAPLEVGAECNAQLEVLVECEISAYCDEETERCVAYPTEGDECDDDGQRECVGHNLYCDSTSGTCEQRKTDGEECAGTDYDECQSYECGEDNRCEPVDVCAP